MNLRYEVPQDQCLLLLSKLCKLQSNVPQDKRSYLKENIAKGSSDFSMPLGLQKLSNVSRETISGQRTTIAKICEEGTKFLLIIFLFSM